MADTPRDRAAPRPPCYRQWNLQTHSTAGMINDSKGAPRATSEWHGSRSHARGHSFESYSAHQLTPLHQNVRSNLPCVMLRLPVAPEGPSAWSTNEKVPATRLAVVVVTVIDPLPWADDALQVLPMTV